MDVSEFESFLAVLETGTATEAAALRFISQPALSRQIHSLEARCRTSLFTRSKSGMVPTRAARLLEPVARDLLMHWANAGQAMSALGERRVPLTVACPTMVAERLVLPFVTESVGLVADVVEVPTTEICSLVAERRVDFALVPLTPPPEVASKRLFRVPFSLQVPRDSPVAERGSVDIRELPELDLIVTYRTSGTRVALDEHLTRAGVRVRYRHEVSRSRIGEALALSGRGMVVSIDPPVFDLAEVPLVDEGSPIYVEEWAAWPPEHYSVAQIESFVDEFSAWMRGRPQFERVEFLDPDGRFRRYERSAQPADGEM